jgi:hypothetical protein
MRTRTERLEARHDLMEGTGDHDVTIVQALVEVCRTIDDNAERLAESHDELRKAIEQLGSDLDKVLRQASTGGYVR